MIRICTLQFGMRDYFKVSNEFGTEYCKRHGYSWHVLGGVSYTDGRDLRWSKIPGVCKILTLPDTQFVLYLDADAVVSRQSNPLDLLTNMIGNKDILIGEDSPGHINTGVWLAKPSALDILQYWETTPIIDSSLCHRWPVDEAGFIELVEPKYRDRILVKKRSALNLVNGFIHHQMIGSHSFKTTLLSKLSNPRIRT